MQKTTIIEAIKRVLIDEIPTANMAAFDEKARLNQDLYLDSVLIMQLLISLETQLSIEVPDEALNASDFETINSLASFLSGQITENVEPTVSLAENTQPEEFEDIKVHCFVSCLCECIKAHHAVDHRPFYFGVWDADVVVTEDYKIHYHADDLNHDFFRHWFERLYGVKVNAWYQADQSKAENISRLLNLIEAKPASQHIMVMLDMYLLPERENKFNQNPFPHYVMLEKSEHPDNLLMLDPDFRWQGEQNKQQVIQAIASEAVEGGYLFDSREITPVTSQAIHDYFIACFKPENNPMTDAVRTIVQAHIQQKNELTPADLNQALANLPVLAIRKYAYEHGLAFFMLELEMPFDDFENWCDVIEQLVSGYKKIQFRAMKIAAHFSQGIEFIDLLKEIESLLAHQDALEFSVKQTLFTLFKQWKSKTHQKVSTRKSEVCL